jgi:hypothetical protein
MDWLAAALNAVREGVNTNTVIILVLILVIDRRLTAMVKSLAEVAQDAKRTNAHNSSRMEEIRRSMMTIAERLGAIPR